MEGILQEKLIESLNNDSCQSIINCEEFYFQKAKDALEAFLNIEINDELRQFLLDNRKNYNNIKSVLENEEVGKLIFTIISYCDTKAYNKNIYNLYQDKRVLALEFVRMNNWVEQLLTYKFENTLQEGSVKNAIDYLLDPSENFTMLSEGHRSLICSNLFNREYDALTFKKHYIDFFSSLSIKMKNELNQTHLLSRLAYMIENLWKESIIGLISPDGTGWQEYAVEKTTDGAHIALWNHKKPNGTDRTLKLLRNCINENGFFRVFYTSNKEVNYVAEIVDFVTDQEQLDEYGWDNIYDEIKDYSGSFEDYVDGDKKANWIYLARKISKVEHGEYNDFKYLSGFGYPSVGCQAPVISYKNSFEINYSKQMNKNLNLLKYKKQIILQGPPGTGKTKLAKEIAETLIKENSLENKTISVKVLTKDYIKANLTVGQNIKAKNDSTFEVVGIEKNVVLLKSDTSKPWRPSYNKIIESFNNKLWQIKGRTGGFKSYEDAIAKYFYEQHFEKMNSVDEKIYQEKDYVSLIQFHPSYTYEDFVRGIVSKPSEEGNGLIYEAENKTLAKFADLANTDTDNSYVLIIDEINRANLSSVLGELIYALEYRGKVVNSMYEVDGSTELILPPNLYIIGTMNTADRSVGHIDYAIRRRFAFVDVLPKDLSNEEGISFDSELFDNVEKLFDNSLSPEFEKKDVQLGHSYFIDKSKYGGSMDIRLQYEIKPILLEYLKDGVLVGDDVNKKIEDLKPSI